MKRLKTPNDGLSVQGNQQASMVTCVLGEWPAPKEKRLLARANGVVYGVLRYFQFL